MQISDVKLFIVNKGGNVEFGLGNTANYVILTIHTDRGIKGVGEAFHSLDEPIEGCVTKYKRWLIGRGPDQGPPPLAGDLSRLALSPRHCRASRVERRGAGALGHRRQGLRSADLQDARGAEPRPRARVRQQRLLALGEPRHLPGTGAGRRRGGMAGPEVQPSGRRVRLRSPKADVAPPAAAILARRARRHGGPGAQGAGNSRRRRRDLPRLPPRAAAFLPRRPYAWPGKSSRTTRSFSKSRP